ncbi:Glucans biosynthesis glucosyltransferase H [uncultured archaeon]|nr:Glucans biosynthesis glucosyltransferase H [uncultured archaeon]
MNSVRNGVLVRILIMTLFVALSAVGLAFSVYLFTVSVDIYTAAIAISFATLSIISGFFNVVSSYFYYRSYFYDAYLAKINEKLRPLGKLPTVAVVIPTYNEEPAMVAKNLASLKKLDYDARKLKYYVLDDSTKPKICAAIERLCEDAGAIYIHRDERKGFKAGALNNMLRQSNEEFLALFDADEYLTDSTFLRDLLPYFGDRKVAFVQSEKKYAKGTFFSDCVDLFDALFFKFIQPSRALSGTAIFAGSCGIIRRSAVDKIGGFPEYIIEDTFFSFESDLHSFTSIYVPKVYALGKPLFTFTELMRQQWRYNYGDTQFLMHFFNASRHGTRRKLSPLSKVDYLTHGFGLNYISVVLILFTVVSVFIVFFSAPFAISSLQSMLDLNYPMFSIEVLGMMAFTLSLCIPIMLTKIYFNSVSKGVMIFALNFALAFVRLRAAMAALLDANPAVSWIKGDGAKLRAKLASSLRNSAMEVAFSTLLFAASAVAAFAYNISGAVWLMWYAVLYSSTFFFFFKYG